MRGGRLREGGDGKERHRPREGEESAFEVLSPLCIKIGVEPLSTSF